jgi:IMP dehydrogenase
MLKKTLTYDDVLLVPRYSDIRSRKEIDTTNSLDKNIDLRLPVIASPMDTVSGFQMASIMSKMGALAVIHRYMDVAKQVEIVSDLKSETGSIIAAAIGTGRENVLRATCLVQAGVDVLCVDVAHGHHVAVKEIIEDLRSLSSFDNVHIMAGNVATPEAIEDLAKWGADSIRIGIGGGSICSTRIQTGHGVPTLQSVMDCANLADACGVKIIADGGIRNSGDIVKSYAAGADFVMIGSLLAGTTEAPGRIITMGDRKYKEYRGMASAEAQMDWRGRTASLEGVSSMIPYKGPVVPILEQIENGIRSGFSYSGARTFGEFQAVAKMVKQTPAGQLESSTHIKVRYG